MPFRSYSYLSRRFQRFNIVQCIRNLCFQLLMYLFCAFQRFKGGGGGGAYLASPVSSHINPHAATNTLCQL